MKCREVFASLLACSLSRQLQYYFAWGFWDYHIFIVRTHYTVTGQVIITHIIEGCGQEVELE